MYLITCKRTWSHDAIQFNIPQVKSPSGSTRLLWALDYGAKHMMPKASRSGYSSIALSPWEWGRINPIIGMWKMFTINMLKCVYGDLNLNCNVEMAYLHTTILIYLQQVVQILVIHWSIMYLASGDFFAAVNLSSNLFLFARMNTIPQSWKGRVANCQCV